MFHLGQPHRLPHSPQCYATVSTEVWGVTRVFPGHCNLITRALCSLRPQIIAASSDYLWTLRLSMCPQIIAAPLRSPDSYTTISPSFSPPPLWGHHTEVLTSPGVKWLFIAPWPVPVWEHLHIRILKVPCHPGTQSRARTQIFILDKY